MLGYYLAELGMGVEMLWIPIKNRYLVFTVPATPGVGVPMCLISAELVGKCINVDHTAGPTSPHSRSNR